MTHGERTRKGIALILEIMDVTEEGLAPLQAKLDSITIADAYAIAEVSVMVSRIMDSLETRGIV